ncbi:MAG: hypothetical protein KDJ65_30675, partial [Anaerolineae bacterium]|nr:hypothetical protein [Anaerolineae bacterium]
MPQTMRIATDYLYNNSYMFHVYFEELALGPCDGETVLTTHYTNGHEYNNTMGENSCNSWLILSLRT